MFFSFLRSRGGSAKVNSQQPTLLCALADVLTLERLDDERACAGDDADGCLTVLDGELDGHAETLPCASRLCDIFTDLLR